MSTESTVTSGAITEESNRLRHFINKSETTVDAIGFGWLIPILRIVAGDNVSEQMSELRHKLLIPLVGLSLFIASVYSGMIIKMNVKRPLTFRNDNVSGTKNSLLRVEKIKLSFASTPANPPIWIKSAHR